MRLAVAVALTSLMPWRAVRENRELRHDLDVMLRVAADLAEYNTRARGRRERHLYLIK